MHCWKPKRRNIFRRTRCLACLWLHFFSCNIFDLHSDDEADADDVEGGSLVKVPWYVLPLILFETMSNAVQIQVVTRFAGT
jgi:hypothetical protein